MAAITVYVDDSGTDPKQPIAVASCIIAPVFKWKRFERQWQSALDEYGATSLHTSECVARNPKSEFATWSDAKVSAALKRFRHIIKDCSTKAFSNATRKQEFMDHVPGDLRELFGENHFCWATFQVLGMIQEWRLRHGITDEFEFVFDYTNHKDTREKINQIFDYPQYEEFFMVNYGIRPDLYSFRLRKDVKLLQASDLMAWTCYQRMLHNEGKNIKQIAIDSWQDFYAHKNKSFLALGFAESHHVDRWVERTRAARLEREQK